MSLAITVRKLSLGQDCRTLKAKVDRGKWAKLHCNMGQDATGQRLMKSMTQCNSARRGGGAYNKVGGVVPCTAKKKARISGVYGFIRRTFAVVRDLKQNGRGRIMLGAATARFPPPSILSLNYLPSPSVFCVCLRSQRPWID